MFAISSEFDLFVQQPVQADVLGTTQVAIRPIATVGQNNLHFVVPADSDAYTSLNFYLYVRCQLVGEKDVAFADETDHTAPVNNFLHSLFSQCQVQLNGFPITQSSDLYNYRALLETLLTYGSDAASTHLTNAYWYPDSGNMQACDPTKTEATNNMGFIARWEREIQLYGRLHADICNVPQLLVTNVRVDVRLTES